MTFRAIFDSVIPDTVTIDAYGAFILFMGIIFFYMLWKASRAKRLDWTDFITAKDSNRASLTKFLQLVGGVVGTWVMVQLTLKDKLTVDYLIVYLTYVGAIEGWSKFVSAKYGISNGNGGEYPPYSPNRFPNMGGYQAGGGFNYPSAGVNRGVSGGFQPSRMPMGGQPQQPFPPLDESDTRLG